MAQDLPEATAVVEKALGQPLTEAERKTVGAALEIRLQTVRKAAEAGEW